MPIAITGSGCLTPIGNGSDAFIRGWRDNVLGIAEPAWATHAPFPVLAACIEGFDPLPILGERVTAGTDLASQLAIVAAEEALATAGLLEPGALDPMRTAVVDGNACSGLVAMLEAQHGYDRGGVDGIPRKAMLAGQSNMAAAQIAIRHGLHGPLRTVTAACASALEAIGTSVDLLNLGRADVAICGGTDATQARNADGFLPVFSIAGRVLGMETPVLDPERASIPFDVDRKGIIFSEGAAWFVLETAAHAASRSAQPLGWVLGVGSCADGHHPVSPEPSGRWQARAIELALADAGIEPEQVDFVMAHATGTPAGDLAEARALERVFAGCDTTPPVTALKGHTGHPGGASAAMSTIAALDVLRTGRLEAVRGTTKVDPAISPRVDVVIGSPRTIDARIGLVNAFGFGGQNACMVIGAAREVRNPTP